MAKSSAQQAWDTEMRAASRAHGLRFVSGNAFLVDDVYITMLDVGAHHRPRQKDILRVRWSVQIKPLAVDPILWAAFDPELTMTERVAMNRRVNGFSVFTSFYRTGRIPEGYVLRPDAGYTSERDEVKLDPDVEPWKSFSAPEH